jgi:nucleoid-associated protein YgaU
MVREKVPVTENKPEDPAAPALIPSETMKQEPVVVEEVKAEVKQNKEVPSEPVLDRPIPPAVRAGPPEIRGEPAGQTIIVERGDTLGKLSGRVYGRTNDRVLDMIQKNNPAIKDPDLIIPGQKLIFPPIPESQPPP